MTASTLPRPFAVVIALLAVYLIWGSTYLAIHFALEGGFTPFFWGAYGF